MDKWVGRDATRVWNSDLEEAEMYYAQTDFRGCGTNMTKHRVHNLHLRPSSALMHAKYGVALRWVDRRKAIGYCVSLPGRMSKYVNLYWNMPLIWRWRNDGPISRKSGTAEGLTSEVTGTGSGAQKQVAAQLWTIKNEVRIR